MDSRIPVAFHFVGLRLSWRAFHSGQFAAYTTRRFFENVSMQIALAPMEGLVDEILRDVLTRVGGIDWCVTEFIRVTERVQPASTYRKLAPELFSAAQTAAGTPLRVQFLGSDPQCLADNAAFACGLGAPRIEHNFGCPGVTVSVARGGAGVL
jgi:tRNA-dihydrouridine synthase C